MNPREKYKDVPFCISRLKSNDEQAFRHIYDLYKGRLFLFALKFLKTEDLAEEVVHDVFLKIWEDRCRLNPELSFNSYIHTICKHRIFNLLKRTARLRCLKADVQSGITEASNQTEDAIVFKEYGKLAEEVINGLPPRRRLVYRLCKEEGKSYQEAAEELGISRDAVKDHLVKAGKTIREFFSVRTDIKFNTIFLTNLFLQLAL